MSVAIESLTENLPKTGVLFINMGGPDDQESVAPFLYNLFSDPDIIKLPFSSVLQKPLAWWIVKNRGEEAKENYKLMGGGSPQLPKTREQAKTLTKTLQEKGLDLPIYIAMRYWHPFTEEALEQVRRDGIEHLIVVSLYPHFSYTTTGSSLNELWRVMERMGLKGRITASVVAAYYKDLNYQRALAECIESGLKEHSWAVPHQDVRILFSAHGLPLRHVKKTKDPYPSHIYHCAKAVMDQYFSNNQWDIGFQSRVGRMKWLGPYTDDVLQYYAGLEMDNILMVPISFVSDHVETLVEIDIQYRELAREIGIQHCFRAPVMNSQSQYIHTLANLIEEKFRGTMAYRFKHLLDVQPAVVNV